MLYQALAGFKAAGRFFRRGDQFEQENWPNWKSMLLTKMIAPVTPDNDLSQMSKTKYPAPHVVDNRIAREVAAMKARYEAQHAAPNMSDKQRKDAEMKASAQRDAKTAADARASRPKWEGKGSEPPTVIEDKAALSVAAAKSTFAAGHVSPVKPAEQPVAAVTHTKASKR